MNNTYKDQFETLTDAQRQAVTWQDGSLLVLAGPGSGKTRVLTLRIARLINETPDKSFRVLALTFTNKAADEMRARVQGACEDPERAVLGTFHSFCMQMLQQHGTHIGVNSDFTIYAQEGDRRELLRDALRRGGLGSRTDLNLPGLLQLIDRMKAALLDVSSCAAKFSDPAEGEQAAQIYALYEEELKRANALDFGSLVLRAFQLVQRFEGVAQTYRRTYKYWLLDEFQDTNRAQYRFLHALAGSNFRNVFAVADDDQIIYQWNGASFQQLQRFRADFQPELLQLPTNYRCPARIVQLANNLVRHNLNRSDGKLPLEVGKTVCALPDDETLLMGAYDTPEQEAEAVARFIATKRAAQRSEIVVIARTRALLEGVKRALEQVQIKGCLAQRRDDFLSPQYQWLQSVLRQASRRQDRRNFDLMVSAYNRWQCTDCKAELLVAQAEATGRSLLDEWIHEVCGGGVSDCHALVRGAALLAQEANSYRPFIDQATKFFEAEATADSDVEEDSSAWRSLDRSIVANYGKSVSLDQYLQHITLQSKEPPLPRDSVALMTIHAAKGKEYDLVCVVGLAEDTLPSYHSAKAGPHSSEMEEERRNCFVAITRAKEQLVLTYSKTSRGYRKQPSRFFSEMGLKAPE